MTKTANELNQESFNSGWWYIDLPIQTGDVCLGYLKSGDSESLYRAFHQRAQILPCELEGITLIREHPLLKQHDIEMVFQLKCKFGGRVLAQRLLRLDDDLLCLKREDETILTNIDFDSLPNYFNDDEDTNDHSQA